MAYKVRIFWSDGVQAVFRAPTALACAEYIIREQQGVGTEDDYPEGIRIIYASIEEEEQS